MNLARIDLATAGRLMRYGKVNDLPAAAKPAEHEDGGVHRAILELTDQGFCIIEMIFGEDDRATDYRFVEANPAFERQSGLVDAVGRRISEFAPDLEEHWFERYGRVALTGEPMRVEGEAAPLGRWFDINAFRVGAPEQRRVAVLFTDITDRKRAEAALHASEERFRGFVTASADVVYRMSPDWTQMRQLNGQGFINDTPEPNEDWMAKYILPEDRSPVQESIDKAIRTKSRLDLEHRVIRADGTPGWTKSRAIPMFNEHGEIIEWLGTASDITARVKTDQSFTRLFEASPAPFLVLAPDPPRFTITEVNDAYLTATMRTREDLVGRALFDAFPDNPNDPTSTAVSNLRASLEYVLTSRRPDQLPGLKYDIARPDGTFEERWWSPVNSPILDEKGEVEAIIHNANDVTEDRRAEAALRESERHQGLLLAELQHRVRNILSMVRSVARRTADNCADVDDYVRHLDGRLAALARVQAILSRDPGRGVDLYDMVLNELGSQAAVPADYQIEGPEVDLSPKAAEVLSLAVHELATNSTKYGALSESRGTIRIRWAVEDRDGRAWLRWNWQEPISSTIDRPSRTGFGTELIMHRVPYELRGTGEMRIGDDEVEATINFPLAYGERKPVSVAAGKDMGQ